MAQVRIPIIRDPSWVADLRQPAGPKEMDTYEDCGVPLDNGALTIKGFSRRVLNPAMERMGEGWLAGLMYGPM